MPDVVSISRNVISVVIAGGTLISGLIALAIVISVVVLALEGVKEVPKVLENWGGIILGFYFGQFLSLVKDYMNTLSERRR